jgi:hypothetical protein
MEPNFRIEVTTKDYEISLFIRAVWTFDEEKVKSFYNELTRLDNIKDVKLFKYKEPCLPIEHFIKR